MKSPLDLERSQQSVHGLHSSHKYNGAIPQETRYIKTSDWTDLSTESGSGPIQIQFPIRSGSVPSSIQIPGPDPNSDPDSI